ncbi:hypothetical protein [Gluconacetobacter entanii]|nr:hypothetical protein [Gluconacetobacter entanii]
MLETAGVSVVASGATVFGVFKLFGGKILDYHFGKRMERIKADNQIEISKLESQLDGKLDRATKFHVLEYQIYPEIWDKLVSARAATESYITGMFQHSYSPDMPRQEQEKELDRLKISYEDKQKIMSSHDGARAFHEVLTKMIYEDSTEKYSDFQNTFAKNSIFFPTVFCTDLLAASNKIREALLKTNPHRRPDWDKRYEVLEKFKRECNPIVESIQAYIRQHLSPRP